jgi:hypothetical protein
VAASELARRRRAIFAAVAVLVAVPVLALLFLAQGGEASDEQAIRAWFESPAGGTMTPALASSIHVGVCEFTDASTQSGAVQMCPITTDAPTTHTLHTCFVLSGGKALRGGWQLAAYDGCNALRFDGRSSELVDVAARAHYDVKRG